MAQKLHSSYLYKGKRVNYTIWSNSTDTIVETIIYLGSLQVGRIPSIVLSKCPPHTIVVQGAPHWIAAKDGNDIPDFMRIFTENSYTFIKNNFTLQHVHIIAESQAAPGAISLALGNTFRLLTLVQPLGLTPQTYKYTFKENSKVLDNRVKSNFKHQARSLFSDTGLLYNFMLISLLYRREQIMRRASNQYGSGLNYDATNMFKELKLPVKIIVGENDEIFPYREYSEEIKDIVKGKITIVPKIPHSSFMSKAGARLLDESLGR